MTGYRLTYFDFDGGRGEPIRLVCHLGGIDLIDERLSFPEFGMRRASLPFHAVPTLTFEEKVVTQSNAILRYLGAKACLYPTDALEALYVDEVMGAVEDLSHRVVATFGMKGEALREAREALVAGPITTYLRSYATLLERGGGNYFAGGALSVADLKMFVHIRGMRTGRLDHVPADLVERVAPTLAAHADRVGADPRIAAYYEGR